MNTFVGFKVPVMAKTLAESLLALNDKPSGVAQQTKVRAQIINDLKSKLGKTKSLRLKLERLTDNKGQQYIAVNVPKAELVGYLAQMKSLLSDDYVRYRKNQSQRDHGLFHLTVINPYEYQILKNSNLKLNSSITITLHGLGKVSSTAADSDKIKHAYYVVASSNDGQFYRQQHLLKAKDFHVTLGFEPLDVHNQTKGLDTLINSQ